VLRRTHYERSATSSFIDYNEQGATVNQDLQQSFRALSDPTRREILVQLSQEDLTIAEVSNKFDISRSAVRKHLTILEEGDLITVTPRGKERVNQLNPQGLKATADWFDYFNNYWDNALSSLKKAIESDQSNTSTEKKK